MGIGAWPEESKVGDDGGGGTRPNGKDVIPIPDSATAQDTLAVAP